MMGGRVDIELAIPPSLKSKQLAFTGWVSLAFPAALARSECGTLTSSKRARPEIGTYLHRSSLWGSRSYLSTRRTTQQKGG
ncbi:hypothetical protein VTK56DRAFT_4965 [Thermocarpiscus australiensis]